MIWSYCVRIFTHYMILYVVFVFQYYKNNIAHISGIPNRPLKDIIVLKGQCWYRWSYPHYSAMRRFLQAPCPIKCHKNIVWKQKPTRNQPPVPTWYLLHGNTSSDPGAFSAPKFTSCHHGLRCCGRFSCHIFRCAAGARHHKFIDFPRARGDFEVYCQGAVPAVVDLVSRIVVDIVCMIKFK